MVSNMWLGVMRALSRSAEQTIDVLSSGLSAVSSQCVDRVLTETTHMIRSTSAMIDDLNHSNSESLIAQQSIEWRTSVLNTSADVIIYMCRVALRNLAVAAQHATDAMISLHCGIDSEKFSWFVHDMIVTQHQLEDRCAADTAVSALGVQVPFII